MARNDHVKFTNFENLFSPEQFNQKLDKSFMGKEVALLQSVPRGDSSEILWIHWQFNPEPLDKFQHGTNNVWAK